MTEEKYEELKRTRDVLDSEIENYEKIDKKLKEACAVLSNLNTYKKWTSEEKYENNYLVEAIKDSLSLLNYSRRQIDVEFIDMLITKVQNKKEELGKSLDSL